MRCLLGGRRESRQQVRPATQPPQHSDELLSSCVCSTSSSSSTSSTAAAAVQASKLTDATTMTGNNALAVISWPCSVMLISLLAVSRPSHFLASRCHDTQSAACRGDVKRATRTEIVVIVRRSLKVSSDANRHTPLPISGLYW